jgi:hypothetical protein
MDQMLWKKDLEEILTINVDITDFLSVKGECAEATMILFGGSCDCENFKGRILPSGVDTQKQFYPERRTLSARYMLEGVDKEGQSCKIFIENNGVSEENDIVLSTTPRIITDSKALAWMEKASLTGTIEPKEKGVIIHIFKEE